MILEGMGTGAVNEAERPFLGVLRAEDDQVVLGLILRRLSDGEGKGVGVDPRAPLLLGLGHRRGRARRRWWRGARWQDGAPQ